MRRRFLFEDAEWKRAVEHSFVSSIRPLIKPFAMTITYCEPADPTDIFDFLTEIFIRDLQNPFRTQIQLSNLQLVQSYVLHEINEHSETMSQHATLSHSKLPNAHSGLLSLIDFCL